MQKTLHIAIAALACSIATGQADDGRLHEAFLHYEAQEYEQAYELVSPIAAESEPAAQLLIAHLTRYGLGTEKDLAAALSYYERSALSGFEDAQYALAALAIDGVEVKRDYEKAAGWLRLAVARGHPKAQARLGALYLDGLGVQRDQAHAIALFQEAAIAGLPEAMTSMGLLVHQGAHGAGLSTADWFERAAMAGDAQGQFLYAISLKEGDGRKRDLASALLWLDRALDQQGLAPEMRKNGEVLRRELTAEGL